MAGCGFGDEAGKVNDSGAGVDSVDLRFGVEFGDGGGRSEGRFEKEEVVAVFFEVLAEVGGGFGDDGAELVGGDDDDAGGIVEFLAEGVFDFCGEGVEVFFGGLEEDIAALDVGFDRGEVEGFEGGFEVGHFDDVVAADIDAAKEGEVGHGRLKFDAKFLQNDDIKAVSNKH